MKKNNVFFVGLLAVLLTMGLIFAGCDDGTTNNDGNGNGNGNGGSLPTAKGTNEVSGKIYYDQSERIVFSVTADGASSGTYTVGRTEYDNETYSYKLDNGKYKYTDKETGIYTWNEDAKTVTLKPERMAFQMGNEDFGLLDKAGYKTAYSSYMNNMIALAKEQLGMTQEQYI